MTQPRGGYGARTSRICYSCSKRRSCYKFNCSSRLIVRVTGLAASPRNPVPLCYECACEVFGVDAIESEIAKGRLSWKSQQTPPQTDTQLSLLKEQ